MRHTFVEELFRNGQTNTTAPLTPQTSREERGEFVSETNSVRCGPDGRVDDELIAARIEILSSPVQSSPRIGSRASRIRVGAPLPSPGHTSIVAVVLPTTLSRPPASARGPTRHNDWCRSSDSAELSVRVRRRPIW